VTQNGVWKAIWWIWGTNRCNTWKAGVPDVVCEVGKGSADGNRGVQNKIEGHKSRPTSTDGDWGARSSPSMQSSNERGGRNGVWNEIEVLLIEVERGIDECPFYRRSADGKGNMERWIKYVHTKPDWPAPTGIKERPSFRRSVDREHSMQCWII